MRPRTFVVAAVTTACLSLPVAAIAGPGESTPSQPVEEFLGPQAGNLLEQAEGNLLEPGEGNLLEPGEGNLLEPGEGNLLEPGEGNLLEPGEGNLLEPANDVVEDAQEVVADLLDPVSGGLTAR